MARHLETTVLSYPIAGTFTISRGSKTSADVIVCTIRDGVFQGRGECVPYKRYGETLESVGREILQASDFIARGGNRHQLLSAMKPGAARNAIDCALWDLEAKTLGIAVSQQIEVTVPKPLTTAYTISLGDPETMYAQAARWAHRELLKVKTGTADDESRIRAVRRAAPEAAIILDANEGWSPDNITHHIQVSAECGVALIEQPLPAGHDDLLRTIDHLVPICADESAHQTANLAELLGKYDAVNIKLDKTGGLTEALAMKHEAQRLGFRIMAGCMVGSSLAMAPAVLLAQDADFVDLDGPLLLAHDCEPGLTYRDSLVFPPERALWG